VLETVVVGGLVDGVEVTWQLEMYPGTWERGPRRVSGWVWYLKWQSKKKITRTRDTSRAPFAVEEVLLCGK